MKRLTAFVVLALGLFLASGPPAAAQPQQVTLLHVNDSHSHLGAWGPKDANLDGTLGGLPKAAAIVAEARATDPQALFVHAGDFMDGDLFFNEYRGVAELKLLQSIGLDALVLGNHEFAYTPAFLQDVLQATWPGGAGGVPILGTNLKLDGFPTLNSWVFPTQIKDVNGVKVGLFGLTTPNGALAKPAPVVIDPDLIGIATTAVTGLHAAGAQVVACVSHVGMVAARQVAQNAPGIDVIVNGHDDMVLDQPEAIARPGGGTTYIVSAGSYYRWVGQLRLSVNGDQVALVDYVLRAADADQAALPAVQAAVDALKPAIVARYGDVFHQMLGWAAQELVAQSNPDNSKRDTPLGNLFTDAYRAWTGTDIGIEATGFLAEALPQGTIVGADVFRSMSFGMPKGEIVRPYRLVTFKMTGSVLLEALETTIGFGDDYFPQISGMRVVYDSRLAAKPGSSPRKSAITRWCGKNSTL